MINVVGTILAKPVTRTAYEPSLRIKGETYEDHYRAKDAQGRPRFVRTRCVLEQRMHDEVGTRRAASASARTTGRTTATASSRTAGDGPHPDGDCV
jgi:hypothetical protein